MPEHSQPHLGEEGFHLVGALTGGPFGQGVVEGEELTRA